MPFRSRETLATWIDEFRTMGFPSADSVHVMEQDGIGGANTGLVGVHLLNASTVTYIQPEAPGSPRWVVTLEPREDTLVLNSAGVHALASELAMVSALCAFLQAKSAAVTPAGGG